MGDIRKKIKAALIIFFIVLSNSWIQAQNLDDLLEKYTGDNSIGYMQPFGDALGAIYNSGWFYRAGVPEKGLHIHVGFISSWAWIPGNKRIFTATTEEYFRPTVTINNAPTIFGPTRGVTIKGDGGTEYLIPGGLDVTALGYAIPQLTIGSLWGTELILRYFGIKLGGEFGSLRLGGVGIRHNLDRYILPNSDVELSVGVFGQAFKIGTQLYSRALMFSAQSGYSLKKWNFYGALGFRTTNADIEYVTEVGEEFNYDLDKTNKIYFTAGAAYHLGPAVFSSDINFSDFTVLSFTIGFEFGNKYDKNAN